LPPPVNRAFESARANWLASRARWCQLRNLRKPDTAKINGPGGGALTVLLGGQAGSRNLITLDRNWGTAGQKWIGLAAKADTQVFGDKGALPGDRNKFLVVQLNALLHARTSSLLMRYLVEARRQCKTVPTTSGVLWYMRSNPACAAPRAGHESTASGHVCAMLR
jgi:hypothetical protein